MFERSEDVVSSWQSRRELDGIEIAEDASRRFRISNSPITSPEGKRDECGAGSPKKPPNA